MNLTWILLLILAGLIAFLLMGESGERIVRRRFDYYVAKYARFITRPVVVPTLIFVALAIVMRDIILTPFLLAVAAGIAYVRIQQLIAEMGIIAPRQVSQLVLAFRGAYQIVPAVFKSLELVADRVDNPLHDIINVAVETYYASGGAPERAFAVLRERCNSPLLDQFVYILEMSESASDESVTAALDALGARLQRHEDLQRQVETGLSSITGQTSFMQGMAVMVAFAVALVPNLRAVYTGSGMGRLGYMILVGVIMGTSYLIERRNQTLKEQIL